jgi:hypothetical protein
MPFRHARARLTHDRAHRPILHIRFLATSLRLCGSVHVTFLDLIPLLPHGVCPGIRDKPATTCASRAPAYLDRLGERLFETLDMIT